MQSKRDICATLQFESVVQTAHSGSDGVSKGPYAWSAALGSTATIALWGFVFEAGAWLWLYFRPSPFGLPFALDPLHYIFHALYYALWAHALLAAPFALWSVQRPQHSPLRTFLHVSLAMAVLALGCVDRECQRFLGTHVSLDWLASYASVDRTPDVILQTLRADRGGAWSSVFALFAVGLFPLALRSWPLPSLPAWSRRRVGGLTFGLLVLPTLLWNLPGGRQRQNKVKPALMLVAQEVVRERVAEPSADELARAVALVQGHYASHSSARDVRFVDARYPLLKRYTGPVAAAPKRRPNFIVLSLETFRAKDMASMNPKLSGTPPTPFLDTLARDAHSAYYPRYYASAVPTVHAFMAIHASLMPHPLLSIPAQATTTYIQSFPQLLRTHGYRAAHFTGSDPDWDSQRVWLNRWYDEVHFHPEDGEQDRRTFRRAAARIRELGMSAQPFVAYIASISNHTPFRVPEPAFAEPGDDTVSRLHGTMRYTDDVVRELYASMENEPWFADTIWIITGDHGFDLGDRGESGSHDNLRHETTWVPLIVHGQDARLPRGEQTRVGSHVDLAPTILDLAHVRDDNAFLGHSLLRGDDADADALIVRAGVSRETRDYSLFQAKQAEPLVYRGDDRTQEENLPNAARELAGESSELADAYRMVIRHVVDHDRLAPGADALHAREPLAAAR